MASSSPASLDFDLQLAVRAGVQSLHSFISLFSLHPPPSSSLQQQQLQHQQSMAASDTITQFKHLGTLLSQRRGHARVRQAPRIAEIAYSESLLSSPNSPPINPNLPSGNLNPPQIIHNCLSDNSNFPSSNPKSLPINPNFSLGNANWPLGNPNLPSSASQGTLSASTNFDECNSGAFDDEGHSIRGSSYIDLINQNDNTDYYEGSINKLFSRRGYSIEAIKARDNYPSIINYDYNDKQNIINNSFPAIIINNDNNFDLNQQAPSLDSSPLSFTSSTKKTWPPLFCPQPPAPPASHEESFSFDAHTISAAALSLVPALSNTPTASSDDEFAEFANSNQRLTVYGGQNQGSLSRQLAQVISTNPNFEAQLEKVACLIPTPTHSCISLEGSLPTDGSLPPVHLQPQQALAIMDHKPSSAGMKRKCPSNSDDSKLTKCGNDPASNCHCAKRRKLKNKSVKRVAAISDKVAEIPNDDYSWRKYGQKPIKGSPYPRGYYKCSGVKGCPAKKHVERALDDPSMLIVTYEGEHIHSRPISKAPSPI